MQRRVPQEFVDVWDAWLQEGLHSTRQQLGERWLDAYLTSPVWRFVLGQGICGGQSYAGVMVPSVDRVGRYFPLAILAPLAAGSCLLEAACGTGRPWFDAAESLALAALEAGDLELDAFDADVEALLGPDAGPQLAESGRLMELLMQSAFASGASPAGGVQWRIPMLGEMPQRAANAFASIALERAFRPCALWWTQGSDGVEPAWLLSQGLPAPASFAAMLTGAWRSAGWNSIELPGERDAAAAMPGLLPQETSSPVAIRAESADAPASVGVVVPIGDADPVVAIAAAHPPAKREGGADIEPRFVTRPEIGLWGVVCAGSGAAPGIVTADRVQGLDLIADAAHDLAPRAPLTALAEEARRMLQRASAAPAFTQPNSAGAPGAVFFLAQGGECALVWMGAMQAVRVRGGSTLPLMTDASAERLEPSHGASPGSPREPRQSSLRELLQEPPQASLQELLQGPQEEPPSAPLPSIPMTQPAAVAVRYEPLRAGDRWVLGSASMLTEARVRALPEALREGSKDARAELGPLLALCEVRPDASGAAAAVMLLAAAPGA